MKIGTATATSAFMSAFREGEKFASGLRSGRTLFAWACEEKPEITPQNPTLGVRKIKYASDGHHSWAPEEIAQYRDRHPLGSKPRLALDLLLYTGGRREDAVRLGPQHVRNGRVRFRQAKNEHRNLIDIDIPLHPELEASIAATRSGHLTFLVTEFGRPSRQRDLATGCATSAIKPICITALPTACARRRRQPWQKRERLRTRLPL